MVYKFLNKKARSEASVNEDLAEELHKPVIRRFKWRKFYARFIYIYNIWTADLAVMESLLSSNCGVKYLLFAIDVFTKYA